MPDSKITALTALTAADPAVDMFPVVDVSDTTMAASGTTKRISINNILACSPAATLASLNVTGSSIPANGLYLPTTNTLEFAANSLAQYRIAPLGVFSWYDGAGGTRMTLNANGLGIGVTPSAWDTNYKALQLGYPNFISGNNGGNIIDIGVNAYFNTDWKYAASSVAATRYRQVVGIHQWFTAPSGTAGNNITWTQAMTLDASGNLLVGTTSSPLASRVFVGVTNAQPDAFVIRNSDATAGLYWRLAYVNSSNTFHILNQSGVGVYLTDGATSWTGTSDERLKDIIEPISNAVAKVGSLRSVIGKFKNDSEGTRRSFLIAQDVQAVLPEAVDTTNADAFGVRYSEVIPLLVAAIKELTARVQTLETR